MEFQELIQARRSVRSYEEGVTIDKADIEAMIACAQEAPSWKNSQVARYYAVVSPEKVASVRANTLPEFNQNSCTNAPALIVTTFVKNRSGFERDGSATNEIGNEWGAYDLGMQNMLLTLKAKELGYDSLVMGIRSAEALRAELNIPEDQEVVAVISIGKAKEVPDRPKRKATEDIVTFF